MMQIPEIGELCSALAVDAVNVQLKFDRYFEEEMQTFLRAAVGTHTSDVSQLLAPLAPRRLRVARFDLTLLAAISTTTKREFAIHALPLNSEFFLRTQAVVTNQSRLTISVEQVPLKKE